MARRSVVAGFLFLSFLMTGVPGVSGVAAAQTGDLKQRQELAQRFQAFRPVKGQIEPAIDQAIRGMSPEKRGAFKKRLTEKMNYEKLAAISVQAMAETFTAAELQKMIDYYGSPEAKAVAEKMPVYLNLVQPEMNKVMDAALMEVRTGESADSTP